MLSRKSTLPFMNCPKRQRCQWELGALGYFYLCSISWSLSAMQTVSSTGSTVESATAMKVNYNQICLWEGGHDRVQYFFCHVAVLGVMSTADAVSLVPTVIVDL